ncbi:MAG: ComF family protein [Alphaproteobacteria bacterium]|nr:ComF family protein [Alphaproteobacteria bacterium]
MTCLDCLKQKPPYSSARAVLRYNDGARDIILGFKHGDKTHAVETFLPWLQRSGADMLRQAELIVPVPLHPWRLLSRRYNQAALLAKALAKRSEKIYAPDLLRRVRHTPSQGHLKRKQRLRNVRSAFAVHPRWQSRLQGARIVLIDDVLTTGATVRECAKILMKAGAARVDVLTLARVVK